MSWSSKLKYWPIIAALATGVAWAADHYIDDRIEAQLKPIETRLQRIERSLLLIKRELGIPLTAQERSEVETP